MTPAWKWLIALLVGLMLLALVPMPYFYYMFLRLVVFVLFCFLVWRFYEAQGTLRGIAWVWIAFAVLYNPILPVHLGNKVAWTAINLVTIGVVIHAGKIMEGFKKR